MFNPQTLATIAGLLIAILGFNLTQPTPSAPSATQSEVEAVR